MAQIDQKIAKAIIHKLGSFGTPPEFGIELFSVGLEPYLRVIEKEYFEDILKYNLSSFKLVTGNYGGGKTHFLYLIRELAWKHNYVTSYVGLSPIECPFDRLELVYKKIVTNCVPPQKEMGMLPFSTAGIDTLLRNRLKDSGRLKDQSLNLDSTSFANALRGALMNLQCDDEEEFGGIVQWLKGEDIPRELKLRYRISERLDRSTAFRMLRSLVQFINTVGYSGIVFLFDEAERGMSISSSRDKRRALDNLRQIIDECGNSRLPGAMFFYAIPDENLLLEGSGGVYEALKQRLRSNFTKVNPMGVKINLEVTGLDAGEFLNRLGIKLASVFEAAYQITIDETMLTQSVRNLSTTTLDLQALDIGYRRLFVIGTIETLQILRSRQSAVSLEEAQQIVRSTAKRLSDKAQEEVEQEEF